MLGAYPSTVMFASAISFGIINWVLELGMLDLVFSEIETIWADGMVS